MTWNAAIIISYAVPIPGREAQGMGVFADALTIFGKLAADGKCSEPEVFHHLSGGGMMILKTEGISEAYEILEVEDVREIVNTAMFTVADFDLEVVVTGGKLMKNMTLYTGVGTELGYI